MGLDTDHPRFHFILSFFQPLTAIYGSLRVSPFPFNVLSYIFCGDCLEVPLRCFRLGYVYSSPLISDFNES